MRIGIVGSEQAKFGPLSEGAARNLIMGLIHGEGVELVVSGECHLGGVDIFAKEAAIASEIEFLGFPPKELSWDKGYKPRNIQIARASDVVHCITLKQLPPEFNGMKFSLCYHCKRDDHVKSGGCWTAKYAKKLGKDSFLHIINPDGGVITRAY